MSRAGLSLTVKVEDEDDSEAQMMKGHVNVKGGKTSAQKAIRKSCGICMETDEVDARLQIVLSTREAHVVADNSASNSGTCLIFPHNPILERFWDPLVMLLLVFTALVTPFEVAFTEPELNPLFVVNQVVNILFVLDTFLVFFVPQFDRDRGIWITNHAAIARRYLSFWFWIDITSCIPFDAISVIGANPELARAKAVRLVRLLRLIKLLRLVRASRLLAKWEEHMPFKYGTFSLLKFGVMLLLTAHWMSCLLGIIPVLDGATWSDLTPQELANRDVPVNWIVAYFEGELLMAPGSYSIWSIYLAGLYFSLMTLTTIGYGDVVPKSDAERGVILVLMLIGGIAYAYAIGSVFSTISSLSEQTNAYKAEKDELADFMDDIGVPFSLRAEVLQFLRMQQPQKIRMHGREIMKNASVPLQTEVAFFQARDWIRQLPFFADSISPVEEKDSFMRALALEFDFQILPPLEILATAFEEDMKLYVITQGSIMLSRTRDFTTEVVTGQQQDTNGTTMSRIKCTDGIPSTIKEEVATGRIYLGADLLVPGATFPYFITTLGFTQLYVMTRDRFEAVLDKFPQTRKGVTAWCATRHVMGKGNSEVIVEADPRAEVEVLKVQLANLSKEITELIASVTTPNTRVEG